MQQDTLLEVNDLTIYYTSNGEKARAVNGISFEVKEREVIGFVGETGAGKTTMALGIMGLVPEPAGHIGGGEILFRGENLVESSEKRMRMIRGDQISMIFQDPMTSLNPVLTVGDQIAEVIRLHNKISKKEALVRAREMLEMVGIPGDRCSDYPHQFSGGMKQRVVIAIALACRPSLLIADEPTTALDVTIQAQVLELISNLKDELGTSMILITHDLGVVAQMCDRVAIMYAGEIVEAGTREEIFSDYRHPYTRALFQAIPDLDEELEYLPVAEGSMPSPEKLPEGCFFHPRCEYADECCRRIHPTLKSGESHQVRCHKFQSVESSQESQICLQ